MSKFIKNAFVYSGTNFVSQVLLFAQGFILRMLLLPEVMGFWSLSSVVRRYISPINMGINNGAVRELSILEGTGNTTDQIHCRSVTLIHTVVEISLLAVCVIGYALWTHDKSTSSRFLALVFAGLLLIFVRFRETYTIFFQGAQLYVPLSKALLMGASVYAVMLPIGAAIAGLPGLFVAALIAEIIRALWMWWLGRRNGLTAGLVWNKDIWKRLVSYGIGLRIADYPQILLTVLPLIWVTKFMGIKMLALYATANGFFSHASEISVRVGTVYYTRMLGHYGQGVDNLKIAESLKNFMITQLLVLVPLVYWAIALFVPFLVRNIIPEYVAAIPAILVLGMANFFISQNNLLFTLWLMEKRLVIYGTSNFFGLIVMLSSLSFFWFILGRQTITDVAIAAVLGHSIYFIYIVIVIGRDFGWKWSSILKILLLVSLASAWTAFVLIYSGLLNNCPKSWLSDLVATLTTALWTFVAVLPVVGIGLWVGGGWKYLQEAVVRVAKYVYPVIR